MCGIVAVLRRPARRQVPERRDILEALQAALELVSADSSDLAERLAAATDHLAGAGRMLCGMPGVTALVWRPGLAGQIRELVQAIGSRIDKLDQRLFAGPGSTGAEDTERVNLALIGIRDALWAIEHDRLGTGDRVRELAGQAAGPAATAGYLSIQTALAAIDRLEVRGRDSAGLHVLVSDHGLDLTDRSLADAMAGRDDPVFRSRAVRGGSGWLAFVYKAAAEIGELGDNVASLRRSIRSDELLRLALSAPEARTAVLGHTRWASVGTISEANAHPLDALHERAAYNPPHLAAVLNGDIDNYSTLMDREELRFPGVITTDAKLIPVLTARRMTAGESLEDAFCNTVRELEGSMAIAASAAASPGRLLMAVRGSGQALYVGLAEDAYVVASEPYGVVEEADSYLRVEGASMPGVRGQIVFIDSEHAGTLEGIDRRGYDGRPIAGTQADLQRAEITTRDIDRRGFPHFLLKEITEAPDSFRKTLRGRIVERDGHLAVSLSARALPQALREELRTRRFRKVYVVGQGTAAIAGQAIAQAIQQALAPQGLLVVATTGSELSGFGLEDDMRDTLVVAVSQSGTTTDTNRTVDLVKARGARVIAIVNRRSTDLAEKADGVVHTSDGRDVEMSVASTKAFYAQVAAGFLLGLGMAEVCGSADARRSAKLLSCLLDLPDAMEEVLASRGLIAGIASKHASRRRHWAVVGSGLNRVAAEEVRIKLSELCYKSVACDSIEDKKHIDLSSEPLVFVCAAGLSPPNAGDVQKEIAIYRAHKAAPVVVGTRGQMRLEEVDFIGVPPVQESLAFVLSAMVGHLFGYEAALAIDAQARPLREIRAAVQELAGSGLSAGAVVANLAPRIADPARRFLDKAAGGWCDGVMSLGPALRLALLLRAVMGEMPLDPYEPEHSAGPAAFLDELVALLTELIDDATRSVDAVKHQAKTVTVGISRSEDAIFGVPLVEQVLRLGAGASQLGYIALRTLAALDPAVAEVTGFTRYRLQGDVRAGDATIHVIDRGGVAASLPSRTERDPSLRGTKRAVLEKPRVEVTIGRSDGRPVILIPERDGDVLQGLILLHVRFNERLEADAAKGVLTGYRPARYEALVAAVTETETEFAEERLARLSMPELLVEPVLSLAERWRSGGSKGA